MRKSTLKLIIFLALFLNGYVFAEKNIHVRLAKSTYHSSQNKTTTIYNYDEKNRLKETISYSSNFPDLNTSMQYIYNDRDDLIEVSSVNKVGTPKNLKIQKVSNLFYHSDNRIIKQVSIGNGKIQSETNVLEWKGDMPVKSMMKIFNAKEKVVQHHTYEFQYKKNNTFYQKLTIEYLDRNQTMSSVLDIEYSDKKAPEGYANEGNFYYNPLGMSYPRILLGSHFSIKMFENGKESYSSKKETSYKTTYDDKGLPISIEVINDLARAAKRSSTTYEYTKIQ